jgi:predicted ester cyclase
MSTNQREAMTAFLDTFARGKRGSRGAFLAEDVVASHWRWNEDLVGRETLLTKYYGPLLDAFPDVDFKILEAYMGDDFVVLRGEFNGTFTKEWAGLAPHGGPVRWRAHDIYKFRDGKVIRMWLANDTLNVARQLGALPDDGTPW